MFPETNCRINGKEPNITGKSIQHTPPLGFLSCQTRQLSIRTVIMIRPHQQKSDLDAFAGYEKEYKGILREVKRAENGTLRDEPHICLLYTSRCV